MQAKNSSKLDCPLCDGESTEFNIDLTRQYFRCQSCLLVFVNPEQLPTRDQERRHYDMHQNSPEDWQYRRFLSRLFGPIQAKLEPCSCGLDFGSGPGTTLSIMFAEAGHQMSIFDPNYAPDSSVLSRRYDFITASEVIEHLHRPRRELELLWNILRPGGWLGLMTKRVRNADAFRNWHYTHDPTHVSFFSMETFEWLAKTWQAEFEISGKDVVLFKKPNPRQF